MSRCHRCWSQCLLRCPDWCRYMLQASHFSSMGLLNSFVVTSNQSSVFLLLLAKALREVLWTVSLRKYHLCWLLPSSGSVKKASSRDMRNASDLDDCWIAAALIRCLLEAGRSTSFLVEIWGWSNPGNVLYHKLVPRMNQVSRTICSWLRFVRIRFKWCWCP